MDDMEPLSTRVQHATNYTLSCVDRRELPHSVFDKCIDIKIKCRLNGTFYRKVTRRRYKKLMAGIGATIPQSREPPVADAATLKAERLTFTTGYTTNV